MILPYDSGYITNKNALSFLLAAGLTDTSIHHKWDKQIKDDDTIGKYYPSNTNGNKMILAKIFDRRDSSNQLILIELDGKGRIIQQTPYFSLDDGYNELNFNNLTSP